MPTYSHSALTPCVPSAEVTISQRAAMTGAAFAASGAKEEGTVAVMPTAEHATRSSIRPIMAAPYFGEEIPFLQSLPTRRRTTARVVSDVLDNIGGAPISVACTGKSTEKLTTENSR